MRKRRVTPIGAAFVALVLLVLLFVVRGALHRPAHVVLPQDASSGDVSDASLDDSAVGRQARRPRPGAGPHWAQETDPRDKPPQTQGPEE